MKENILNTQNENNLISIYEGVEFDKVYKLDNYKAVVKNDCKKCIIFFSGSGIYYPNNLYEFERAFVYQDKYEWYSYDTIPGVGKYIWVRDVAKQFYILGINAKINSMEDLIDLLRKETAGYEVVCVGSSAGAYAATVVGEYINAEYILNFSGFFSLNIVDKKIWPVVAKYESDQKRNVYYDLKECITQNNVPVFYFYPNQLEGDEMQAQVVKGIKEVYSFEICTDIHGIPFFKFALKKLMSMDKYDLIDMHNRAKKIILTRRKMTELIIGKNKTFWGLICCFFKILKK